MITQNVSAVDLSTSINLDLAHFRNTDQLPQLSIINNISMFEQKQKTYNIFQIPCKWVCCALGHITIHKQSVLFHQAMCLVLASGICHCIAFWQFSTNADRNEAMAFVQVMIEKYQREIKGGRINGATVFVMQYISFYLLTQRLLLLFSELAFPKLDCKIS